MTDRIVQYHSDKFKSEINSDASMLSDKDKSILEYSMNKEWSNPKFKLRWFVGETQAQGGGAGGGAGAITAQISRGTLRTSTGGGGGGWGAAGGAGQQKTTGPEYSTNIVSGSGGGSNSAGSNGTVAGAGTPTDYSGAAGGKAINLNGYTVTYLTTGTVWGAVS
jgi:hypothetical protein